MEYLFLIGDFILSILLGVIIIPRILLISRKKNLYDSINARKVHEGKVPRLGGLCFFPVILITICLSLGLKHIFGFDIQPAIHDSITSEYLFLACGASMLYLVGEMDDLIGVRYKVKFLIQIITASLVVISGVYISDFHGLLGIHSVPTWFGMSFSVFLIMFITNAINLIDGVDGLASGLCIIALAVLCGIFTYEKAFVYAMLNLSTIGAIIPFWFYNVFGNQRAGQKIFMGDTGSLTLGVLLGFLAIKSFTLDNISDVSATRYMIVAFSTLLVPMFDVIRVACFRMSRKHNPFLPDKNHIHHKLIRTGMRLRFVMLTIILIDISFIIINCLLAGLMNVTFIIFIDIFIWILLQIIINKFAKVHEVHEGLAHDDRGNVFQESDPSLFGTEIPTRQPDEDDDD